MIYGEKEKKKAQREFARIIAIKYNLKQDQVEAELKVRGVTGLRHILSSQLDEEQTLDINDVIRILELEDGING